MEKRKKARSPSSKKGTRYLKARERRFLREALWNEQHGFCAICGEEMALSEVTIDHIIPVSQGGSNRRANMRAAHAHCNLKRQDILAASPRYELVTPPDERLLGTIRHKDDKDE